MDKHLRILYFLGHIMSRDMDVKIVERLNYLMKIESITQYALAKKLGICQSTVSNWLHGKKEPSIESLWKLADFFDVTVDYLIGRAEE